MPTPTIPLWGQFLSNGFNNIRDIWKTAKEKASHMTREQEAEAVRRGDQWVTDNVLPVVTTVGELIPQTSIPMAAYNTSEAVKKGNYEEAFQHALTPVLTGSVSKGVNLGLKTGEKAVDAAGKALKNMKRNPKLLSMEQPVAKTIFIEPRGVSPQEAATTYHFDGRMPLTREISTAERAGIPKGNRNSPRGKISAAEYSGLPKGDRNNGRYGNIYFIRHMDTVPEITKDGFVQIAPEHNYFANFTTDQLMTPHKFYPKTSIGRNTIIVDPEAFRGTTPMSLNPGDSFFVNSELKIKPKHVTFISGDQEALNLATQRGFNTMSSPRLKTLSRFDGPKTAEEIYGMRSDLEKRGYWSFGRDYSAVKDDAITEVNRIINSRFNRPSLSDYSRLQKVTGVPTNTFTRKTAPWDKFIGPKKGYREVIYDTVPDIEYKLTKQIGTYAHPHKESMEGWSPIFFRLMRGWTPIKKQGGKIKSIFNPQQ